MVSRPVLLDRDHMVSRPVLLDRDHMVSRPVLLDRDHMVSIDLYYWIGIMWFLDLYYWIGITWGLFHKESQINLGRLIWLGLNDRDNEGVLKWADGSPASYTNLDVKPSVGIDKQTSHYHDCVYQTIFPKLSWILEHCYSNHVMHAACKVPKGVPVDEIGTNTTVVGNIPICDEYGAEWKSFDNHCYYVHNNTFQQLTFHEALDQCQTMNSSLVSIHSLDENNFIVSLQKDMGIWLGLHILNSTELQWTDGSPVDFIHLAPRSLDSMYGVFRCVRMMPFFATGMWERANCNDLIVSFMCKKPREGADIIGPLVPGGATESKADEDDDKDKFCPSDFVSSHFGDKCYYVSQPNNYQTFLGAQKYCHDRLGAQAELVSIQSAIEQDFVLSLLGGMRYPAWIGLLYMYRIVYGYFTWANNEAVGYSKLLTSLLNKDMCAQILVNSTHAGQWSMVDCHAYLPFVCQTKKSSKYRSCASQQRPQENNATCAPSGTSCYKLLPDSLTRQMASSACQKDGGHLVSITTPFEQAFVNVVLRDLKQTPVWIGLKNMGNGLDMFAWDDGRPYGTFTAWESEFYRSTKRENCVQVIDQRWTNTNCDVKAQALCEYGPAPTHPPAVQCPEGSTMFERECYRVKVSDAVSWGRAVNACREVGMNLTSVHSEDEEKFLKDLWREEKMKVSNTNTQKFWIGLKHILPALEEGFWAWEDGTPMDFTKLDATRMWSWQRSQVIDEESCTLMSETPQVDWELARCDDDGAMFGYICKVSAQPVNKNENYDSRSGDVSTAKSGLPYTRHGASISSSDKDKILQGREIAGIVIGCLCVIAIVGGAIYMFIMRNHAHKQSYSPGSGFVNAMYRKSRDLAQEDEDSSERGSSEMDKSTMKLCDT